MQGGGGAGCAVLRGAGAAVAVCAGRDGGAGVHRHAGIQALHALCVWCMCVIWTSRARCVWTLRVCSMNGTIALYVNVGNAACVLHKCRVCAEFCACLVARVLHGRCVHVARASWALHGNMRVTLNLWYVYVWMNVCVSVCVTFTVCVRYHRREMLTDYALFIAVAVAIGSSYITSIDNNLNTLGASLERINLPESYSPTCKCSMDEVTSKGTHRFCVFIVRWVRFGKHLTCMPTLCGMFHCQTICYCWKNHRDPTDAMVVIGWRSFQEVCLVFLSLCVLCVLLTKDIAQILCLRCSQMRFNG